MKGYRRSTVFTVRSWLLLQGEIYSNECVSRISDATFHSVTLLYIYI